MNILFITLLNIQNLEEHGLYQDLLREFVKHGHRMTVLIPNEMKNNCKKDRSIGKNYEIRRVNTGAIQKTNLIEKGINTLLVDKRFSYAIKKYYSNQKFDAILYSTPPITLTKTVKYIKRTSGATSILMLKDIFPQNAIDLGLLQKHGLKGIIYKYFLNKEKELYSVSDYIGCTSSANEAYIHKHNPFIPIERIIKITNSVDLQPRFIGMEEKEAIYEKYHISSERTVFFYGGNLGVPQDIPFIIRCLKENSEKSDRFFVFCGMGTSYPRLEEYFKQNTPQNAILLPYLPKEEYDQLVRASDVGLVFLDHRFTVPNCPARFYTYLEYAKPVLACTDKTTDIYMDILNGDFGWWCESINARDFTALVDNICGLNRKSLQIKGQNARQYLETNYSVEDDCIRIIESIEGNKKATCLTRRFF